MKLRYFLKCCVAVIMATALFCSFQPAFASTPTDDNEAPGRKLAKQAVKGTSRWTTTDHSHHEVLKQNFTTGEEITKACISCHSSVTKQFHKTIHWTWLAEGEEKGKTYGKAGDSVNTFCLSGNKMEDKGCLSCHPGWNKKGVDGEINCLQCHSNSDFNFIEAFGDIKSFEGDDDPETRDKAKILKATGYFRKPVDGPALLDAINWAFQMDEPGNKLKKVHSNKSKASDVRS